jgi:hypothetical protein
MKRINFFPFQVLEERAALAVLSEDVRVILKLNLQIGE